MISGVFLFCAGQFFLDDFEKLVSLNRIQKGFVEYLL